ncbi:MAG: hypothetical protein JXB88_04560 [Spirochaetales bacterium]|nr:hypothetical protein [Spirochaetales bacterium]
MGRLYIYTPGSNDMKLYQTTGEEVPVNKKIIEPSKQVAGLPDENNTYRMDEKGIICEPPLDILILNKHYHVARIAFPLIAALTAYIHEHHEQDPGNGNEEPDPAAFLLIASNQEPQREQDTLYVCDLLKRYLLSYGKFDDVIIEQITCNVSNYDDVSGFFQLLIKKRKTLFENTLDLYRVLGPGTPAMNTGGMHIDFAFHVQNLYAERAGDTDTVIREMNFFSLFKKQDEINSLRLFLDNYNYKAASMFLQKTFLRPEKVIADALTLIDYRLHMNYEEGVEKADFFKMYIPDKKSRGLYNFMHSQICFFNTIKNSDVIGKTKIAVKEFYYLMENDVKTGDYNALVAHLFTIFENLDECLFYTLTGKAFIKTEKEGFKEFKEFLTSNNDIWEKIKNKTGKEDLNKVEPNAEVKHIIFTCIKEKGEYTALIEEYREIQKDTININKLREFRNKGPFAHGYTGVNAGTFTSERFFKEKGAAGLLENVSLVLKNLEIIKGEVKNPYETFNNQVCCYVEGRL